MAAGELLLISAPARRSMPVLTLAHPSHLPAFEPNQRTRTKKPRTKNQKMTRVTQYIVGELLATFAVALLGMTLLLMLVVVGQEAVRQGLGPEPVLRLLPFLLPRALVFAVPGTILFAVCSVYGRLAADNEALAVMSVGVPPSRILRPAFVLAICISLVTVWLDDMAGSWGRIGARQVILTSIEQIVYGRLRTQRSYTSPTLSINVKGVQGRVLLLPTVTVYGERENSDIVVSAEKAELRFDPQREVLSVMLTNGEAIYEDRLRAIFPDTLPGEIPLSTAAREDHRGKNLQDIAMWEVPAEIIRQRELLEQLEKDMAAEAAMQLATGDPTALDFAHWGPAYRNLRQRRQELNRLYTVPWRRWATGFSCFFFVLVGAPMAMYLRTGDLWTTFGKCFVPILFIYYPLLMFGLDQAKAGNLPPSTVWMGNLGLLGVGLLLLNRVARPR